MDTETWLVTGHTGFIGRHILDELGREAGASRRVVGLSRSATGGHVAVDLADIDSVLRVMLELRPDVVIHAAGSTRPEDCFETNAWGTALLLQALKTLNDPITVVLLGSAAELGPVPVEHLPVGPGYKPRPVSPYGKSKCLATLMGFSNQERWMFGSLAYSTRSGRVCQGLRLSVGSHIC